MRMLKRSINLIMVAALAVILSPTSASAAANPRGHDDKRAGWCLDFDVRVAAEQQVAAEYCQPWRFARGHRAVDVLTHGATYDHRYWDWGLPGYSYVDRALADGRATLNYDRIGNGASTRPASSTQITMASDAAVLHRLVQLLRLFGFREINSVSHSYGSGVALQEAATYADVTRVVVSGYLHRPSNPAVTAGNYPANLDAKFAGQGLDSGWLTSRPGVRGTSFHSPSSDPFIVEQDETRKDLVSLTGLLGFLSARGVPAGDNVSNLVAVPVLVLTGEADAIFCYQPAVFDCSDRATVALNEAPFYEHAPSLSVFTVPGSGHSLTLHPSAGDSYRIIDWFVTR
jgi:pimeloyl-ACP methyl ester carboxylesterase